MADEEAEIVIGAGRLSGELLAGGVGEIVSLSEAHFLALLSCVGEVIAGG